ncbi:MAG TPA: hypothetical protein VLJ39_01415 [Tepidisphaeraceae bacterium]|jgi:hypothetical protein|nr:hypothetical protein [Tepidisphaeraceae bacterium]
MFKLIKLAIYGLLGYAIYEFVRGMTAGQGEGAMQRAGGGSRGGAQRGGQQRGSRELNEALDSDSGRMNMTGPAQGARVTSEEASGESVPHTVGRGVIHPA